MTKTSAASTNRFPPRSSIRRKDVYRGENDCRGENACRGENILLSPTHCHFKIFSLRYLDVGAAKKLKPPVISPHQKRTVDAAFTFKEMMNGGGSGGKEGEGEDGEGEEESVENEEDEGKEEENEEDEIKEQASTADD